MHVCVCLVFGGGAPLNTVGKLDLVCVAQRLGDGVATAVRSHAKTPGTNEQHTTVTMSFPRHLHETLGVGVQVHDAAMVSGFAAKGQLILGWIPFSAVC